MKYVKALCLCCVLGFWAVGSVKADTLSLAWDPDPESGAMGYVLYYGASAGSLTNRLDVGSSVNASISGLQAGVPFSFYVTAYDFYGLESDPSNVIAYTPALPDLSNPVLNISSPANGAAVSNAVLSVSGSASDDKTLSGVYYQVNSGGWQLATGLERWSAPIVMDRDTNLFRVYAEDTAGNRSSTNEITLFLLQPPTGGVQLEFIPKPTAQALANGIFEVQLMATAAASVVIETSLDLVNWTPIQTNSVVSGVSTFSLPASASLGQFYRALTAK